MALPKLDTPTYQLELPSNQQVIKYRPFLVKEQKILITLSGRGDKDLGTIMSFNVQDSS